MSERLRRQQEEVEAELAKLQTGSATGADVGVDLDRLLGEVPEGRLRNELKRLIGLDFPADDEDGDPLAHGVPMEEAEDLARVFEEEGVMPPPPPGMFPREPEPAESFMARLEESLSSFEARIAGRRRKRQQRKNGRSAGDSDGDVDGTSTNDAQRGKPWDGPFSAVSTFPQDIAESVPAPNVPSDVAAAFDRAQRVLYVLRRAHMDSTCPTAAMQALKERDILSPSVFMEDPWLELAGEEAVQAYVQRLRDAGVTLEIDGVFARFHEYRQGRQRNLIVLDECDFLHISSVKASYYSVSDFPLSRCCRPQVRCCVVADTFLMLPIPDWYWSYLALHDHPIKYTHRTPASGPRPDPDSILEIALHEHGTPPETALYPRMDPAPSAAEQKGTAHAAWMQSPMPVCSARQVIVHNALCWLRATETAATGNGDAVSVAGLINRSGHTAQHSQGRRPERGLLPASAELLAEGEGWRVSDPPEEPPEPALPRAAPANLAEHPLTQREAEQLLKTLYGDMFESVAAQLPKPKPPPNRVSGEEDIMHLRVMASWMYSVDPDSGKVFDVQLKWGGLTGPFPDVRDAYDIFLSECALLDWEVPGQAPSGA